MPVLGNCICNMQILMTFEATHNVIRQVHQLGGTTTICNVGPWRGNSKHFSERNVSQNS